MSDSTPPLELAEPRVFVTPELVRAAFASAPPTALATKVLRTRRRRRLLVVGALVVSIAVLTAALLSRSLRSRRAVVPGPPELVATPVDPILRGSLVALGIQAETGGAVRWQDTGVIVSSDGLLLADQAAWPGNAARALAGVSTPTWEGPLLCVLIDRESGLAVLRIGAQFLRTPSPSPPELSTETPPKLAGQIVRFRPDLGDFRQYAAPLLIAGGGGTAAAPALDARPAWPSPGLLFSPNLRELIALLRRDGKGENRAVHADQLQALMVRSRAATSRPCGTVVALPASLRSTNL